YTEQNGTAVEVVGWDGESGSLTGGFEAGPEAKPVAQNIIDQGVDVLLPGGGAIYQPGLHATKESGRDIAPHCADAGLGVPDPASADFVLTSILKDMTLSTYEATKSSANGEFDCDAYIGTLENEGVGIAELHNFEDKVDPELWTAVQDLQQKIIDGEVTVTS